MVRGPPTISKPRLCIPHQRTLLGSLRWDEADDWTCLATSANLHCPSFTGVTLRLLHNLQFPRTNKIFYIDLNFIFKYSIYSHEPLSKFVQCFLFAPGYSLRVYLVYGACKRFKRTQRHRSLVEFRIRKVRYQDLLLL
jgi:hypothetical protein